MDEQEIFSQLIGKAIRENRIELQKTLENIASDIQMDDKHIGRIERGEKSPQLFTFYKLSRELGFSSDELFNEIARILDSKQRE
ncbi:helix-turn-helix domain-containing protein [Ornithinibacillus contaminans]|uniref:helix-turn-helix domain-containing protein n=1 Tax=Ornithinibacillus contaminans TaxID=694055 RepID=UPI00069DF19B|nr:helix-turn-helix transcriptional regulator [Ornithinibacillus contaminans]